MIRTIIYLWFAVTTNVSNVWWHITATPEDREKTECYMEYRECEPDTTYCD